MTPAAPSQRVPATAPLLYWLLLVAGLGAYTAERLDEPAAVASLWVGTILGAATGQLAAWGRFRLWLVPVFLMCTVWIGVAVGLPVLRDPWLLSLGPAALCAYLASSERSALLACWFPAALWMVPILDGVSARDRGLPLERWTMLAVFVTLVVAFLRARATRQLAIWRSSARVTLSRPEQSTVLRRAPLRGSTDVAWFSVAALGAVGVTAWTAPFLWRDKSTKAESSAVSSAAANDAGAGVDASGVPCCPKPSDEDHEGESSRIKDYFDPRPKPRPAKPPVQACARCNGRVASGSTAGEAGSTPRPGQESAPAAAVVAGPAGVEKAGTPPATSAPARSPAPEAAKSPAPVSHPSGATPASVASAEPSAKPAAVEPAAPGAQPIATPPAASTVPVPVPVVVLRQPAAPAPGPDPWRAIGWLFPLSIASVLVVVGGRILKRVLVIRHLRAPMWPETVDQRVSNLWHLVLVGLRDAGWHPVAGEQPTELARRVGIEALTTCASVLERARHGVRVDAADLAAMERGAWTTYREARLRASWPARAASWIRSPLV